MASILVKDLTPKMQQLYKKFDLAMKKAGIKYKITCTSRSYQEQLALYSQGRQSLLETNNLRKAAGQPPITQKENVYKVTWTLDSKHVVDKSKGKTQSRAFDIVLLTDGRSHWDLKVDVTKDLVPDYKRVADIGRSVGLKPGADKYRYPDYPHFEDPIN